MRLFRAVIVTSGATVAIGFGLALWGWSVPIYLVDVDQARTAFHAWCTVQGRIDPAAGKRYLALFSLHYTLIDIGIAVILAGLTAAGLAYALRYNSVPEVEETWLRSPRNRWTWLLIGLGIVGWLHAANVLSLSTDLYRQMLPVCADSIGIPLAGLTIMVVGITPMLVAIGALIIMGFGILPAPLRRWDGQRQWRSWGISAIFGALMLVVATLAIISAPGSSSTGTPALVVALYILASTRAALLMPRIVR